MKLCYVACPHLSVTEAQQSAAKEPHICNRYNKQVKHLGNHPRLVRLAECDLEFGCKAVLSESALQSNFASTLTRLQRETEQAVLSAFAIPPELLEK